MVQSYQHIVVRLVALGFFSIFAILGMLYWMTHKIDLLDHHRARDLVELSIDETRDSLRLAVTDYAYWTYAYDLVRSGNTDEIYENIGVGAAHDALFDQLFILSHDGVLMHAFDEDIGANADDVYPAVAMQTLFQTLQMNPAEDSVQSMAVIQHDGTNLLVVMAWITPADIAQMTDAQTPVLAGVIKLDQTWLEGLSARIGQSDVSVSPYENGTAEGLTVLQDTSGRPMAVATWTQNYLGTQLRGQILPAILAFCLVIIAICATTSRYFQAQHRLLRRANSIAMTDQLTGLLNRAGLEDQLRKRALQANLDSGNLAVIYLDLNGFKAINDKIGHRGGDIALRVTAERLQSAIGDVGFAARLGGDEFVCVIQSTDPETEAMALAEQIATLTQAPIDFDGHTQVVSAAIGLALAAKGTQWETLLSQSDAAMYWSKKKATAAPVLFCKSMDSAAAYSANFDVLAKEKSGLSGREDPLADCRRSTVGRSPSPTVSRLS